MFIRLSYILSPSTQAPGGRPAVQVEVDESLNQGHLGNTFYYRAWNHAGTHIDAPAHMLADGQRIAEFPVSDFVFEHPRVIDVPRAADELIGSEDLARYAEKIVGADLLLLRTGFSCYRQSAPEIYRDHNPGLSVDVAQYLAGPSFHTLRAVGIDSISMAAANHLDEGVAAHKCLFARLRHPILLIEDLDLTPDLSGLRRVIVAPHLIAGLDSAHCTVIAELATE